MPVGLGTNQTAIIALGLIETILNNSLSGGDSATLGDAQGRLGGVLDSIIAGDNMQAQIVITLQVNNLSSTDAS